MAATRKDFVKWGTTGGKKRARRLTPKRRRQIARKGALIRWLNERAAEKTLADQLFEGEDKVVRRRKIV